MWANSIDSQLDMKGGWVTKSYEASELGHSVWGLKSWEDGHSLMNSFKKLKTGSIMAESGQHPG